MLSQMTIALRRGRDGWRFVEQRGVWIRSMGRQPDAELHYFERGF
jgi:hypothetical protein